MIEFIGWTGSLIFAMCALPQAWTCYKQGHGEGLSAASLWLWVSGEIVTLAYVVLLETTSWPLVANYVTNLAGLTIVLRYKYWPREKNGE